MLMKRQSSVVAFTLWGLLLLWVFFGGLVLAELLQVIPETAAVDTGAPDLDATALADLGSGLKSSVPSLDIPSGADLGSTITELLLPILSPCLPQPGRLVLQTASSRPLYQRLSIYRI
jgi:hypothetical protein